MQPLLVPSSLSTKNLTPFHKCYCTLHQTHISQYQISISLLLLKIINLAARLCKGSYNIKSNYGTNEKIASSGHSPRTCKILEEPGSIEMQVIVQNLDSVSLLRYQQFRKVINHQLCTMTTNYPPISKNNMVIKWAGEKS